MKVDALSCKVVLIGESCVGKTSIITRFTKDTFDHTFKTTVGASYSTKSIKYDDFNKMIKFEIWDTAGQERFRSLTKFFYKVILVYDITKEETYKQMKSYWYKQISDNSSNSPAIAANKIDEFDQEKVSEREVKEFAKEIGATFRYTSAKSGKGIEELFTTLGGLIIDPNHEVKNIEPRVSISLNSPISKMELETGENKTRGKGCCV